MSNSEGRSDVGGADMNHLSSIIEAYKQSMAVASACELELFDVISTFSGQTTAANIAESCGWNPDLTQRLMNAMVSLKLLSKDAKGSYHVTGPGQYLRRHGDASIWGYKNFMHRMMKGFSKLPDEIKTGAHQGASFPEHIVVHKPTKFHESGTKNQKPDGQHDHQGHHQPGLMDETQLLARYKYFDGRLTPHARALVSLFDLSEFKTAVDLGGGSGLISFELSRQYSSMNVKLFDVPSVIKLVKEKFWPKDDTLNVEAVAGDFFEGDIPDGDLYILALIVHDWSTPQVTTLLRKVASRLPTGGGLLLMEKCLNDDKDGPVCATMWDLLVMTHSAGRLRSGAEYRLLLESTGFKDVKIIKTQEECTYDAILAYKV